MPVRVVSTRDQQPITVNALVENPLVVPERVVKVLDGQFVMDQVLRDAGTPKGGAVQFRVSSPIFPDVAPEIVNEGAEIPVTTVTRGDISTAPTKKRGLAVVVTREMRDRNQMGEVDRQINAVKNGMLQTVDGVFVTTLRNALTLTRAATAAWSGGTATIRKDINAARRLIKTAQAPNAANSYTGFIPDTLLMSPVTEENLLNSSEFVSMIFGSINPSNISSLSQAPNGVLGLKPLVTYSVADNEAFVVASKEVGGYADEVPLESTELYEQRPRQQWRSDTVRTTVGFIDQPNAAARITGI